METRKKQVTKAGRLTVPFYNPPTRHYGQTPSEIIREARASVMNTSAGIKPVPTNRPFTPKEKERTLFGNVRRRLSRPPSSFSLSYLQTPEALPRIKLPAIQTVSRKRNGHNIGIRSVQSLDNLLEDYESESLKDSDFDFKGLPGFNKMDLRSPGKKITYSKPLSGSFSSKIPERSIFTMSQQYSETLVSPCTDDLYFGYSENSRKGQNFPDKGSQPGKRALQAGQPVVQAHNPCHETDSETPASKSPISIEKTSPYTASRLNDRLSENINTDDKGEIYESKPCVNNLEGMQPVESGELEKFTETLTRPAEIENAVDNLSRQVYVLNGEGLDPSVFNCNGYINPGPRKESSREKSVATEIVPEYLLWVNNAPRNANIDNSQKSKEIHELYETALYYSVLSNRETGETNKEEPSSKRENNATKYEKESFNDGKSRLMHSDYLNMVKENIKNFDLKMKNLNANIESFEEKLNAEKKMYCPTENEANTSEVSEFKMNNLIKHRVAGENKNFTYRRFFNDVEEVVTPKKEPKTIGWDGFWKNSYYRPKDEMDTKDMHHSHLQDNLTRLTQINKKALTDSEIKEILCITSEIYKLLKNGYFLHKHTDESETKIKILRSVYNFADNEHHEILLSLARIVFALKIENSLSAACKMVFKVARSDANDHLFLEMEDILELFLDGIGLASPLEEGECCIYGYGALKFLTMNHRILNKLIGLGVLDLLILHLKIISSAKLDGLIVKEQTQYALFQLTGALRNIAAGEGVLHLFLTTNSIPVICKILYQFRQYDDIVTNISRILSQLSPDEDVTQALMSVENILAIITELLDQYKSNDKILIRLSYCLGNIVAYNDRARVQLSRSECSIATLIGILQFYMDKDLDFYTKKKTDSKIESKHNDDGDIDIDIIEDVIVKVVRIIANMCMNPVVGSNLSPNEDNKENSLKLSHLLTTLLQRKDPGITLLACLGCLNNISYYCNNPSSLMDITEGIIRVLGLHDEECKAEAARVLGNVTRHKNIRDLICSTGGIYRLTKLLESNDKDVYRSACGALVNLMLNRDTRIIFVESHGVDKLIEGLEKFPGDWLIAELICRAIWNSCVDDMDTVTSHNDLEKLVNILASSLDEDNWNDGDPVWEEFALLATDLLEKINAHLELS